MSYDLQNNVARRKPSHIPIFPDSYHKDTTHLTTEEHGAYFLLMMAAWGADDCTLPNNEKRLAALAKMPLGKWRKIADTVLEFWTLENGRLHQKRLLKEWHYVQEKSAKQKAKADKRWSNSAQPQQCRGNAVAMHLGGGGGGGGGDSYGSKVSITRGRASGGDA
jgi:uncharacterized protein YdaU (DUF1376 family)